ncbi:MFS transporter [Levilactobacillus tongjiangensis]|uniref:MFS transporter n=1 Tax=Levilactobacillus tongjiangensis TaxID=2486023 RepID=A0ABW1SU39_9LACO|nr:MFS transporter [Levilactobacillus tongjiangensis]
MDNKKFPNAGARLDRLPTSKFHWKIFGIVAIGLLVNWSNAIGGLILAQLAKIGWTNNSVSATFTAINTAGMFLGALLGGIIADRIGRRKSYLLFVALHVISMIIGAMSPNMTFLIVLRFFMGFALGALITTLFAAYTEYVPSRSRGTWSSRVSFIGNWSYPVCSLIAMAIAPLLSPNMNWRVQLLVPAVLAALVFFLVLKAFPESPRWLETKGKYAEANEILDKVEADVSEKTGKKFSAVEDAAPEEEHKVDLPYSALFHGELLKRVILGSAVLIAMNVVQYTLINWLPTIFLAKGINLSDSVFLNTMNMFGAPIGIFITTFIIDKVPRKVMGSGLLIVIAILGYFYSLQTSLAMISLVGFFLIILVYMYVCFASAVYVPEIWPTAAKVRGSGLANAVGRVSGIIAPYGVAYCLDNVGVTGVFIMLGATSLIVAVVIMFLGIESRNQSVEEIGEVKE